MDGVNNLSWQSRWRSPAINIICFPPVSILITNSSLSCFVISPHCVVLRLTEFWIPALECESMTIQKLISPKTITWKLFTSRLYTTVFIHSIHHFRINRSLAGWAHSQRRVGVNITIPLHWPSCEWTLTLPIFLSFCSLSAIISFQTCSNKCILYVFSFHKCIKIKYKMVNMYGVFRD